MTLENRMKKWVVTRIGVDHMQPKERAMRLLEEAVELAQSEGISRDQVFAQKPFVMRARAVLAKIAIKEEKHEAQNDKG